MRLDPQRGMPMTKIGAADVLPRCGLTLQKRLVKSLYHEARRDVMRPFQGVRPCRKDRRSHQGVVLQPITGLERGERGLIGTAPLQRLTKREIGFDARCRQRRGIIRRALQRRSDLFRRLLPDRAPRGASALEAGPTDQPPGRDSRRSIP